MPVVPWLPLLARVPAGGGGSGGEMAWQPEDAGPDAPTPPDLPGDRDDEGGDDEGGPGDDGWVTLAMFWSTVEAHLARLRLESEDVPVVLIDENLSNTTLFNIATGGVKLMVPREEQARARRLLNLGSLDLDAAFDADGSPPPRDGFGGGWARCLVLPVVLSPLLLLSAVGLGSVGVALYLLGCAVGGIWLVTRD